MKLRIPIVPILEFLRFEFGGLLQQKKILDSNLDLLLNCFAWFMEGSIVCNLRCIYRNTTSNPYICE